MTDAHDRVPNSGEDVNDATEPAPEYDQLGSDGNPFERVDTPRQSVEAAESDESFPADAGAEFDMGVPSANDPQAKPDGPGPT
jgi:hypothetical protein